MQSQATSRPNPRRRSSKRQIPDWTPCGYCFARWATTWDHLTPWSKGGLTVAGNLYPSCPRCNHLLSNLSFDTIQEKREYVRTVLIERGQWKPSLEGETVVSVMPEDVREDAEDAALLQPGLPKKGLGAGQEEYDPMPNMPNTVHTKKAPAKLLQRKVPMGSLAKSKGGKHDRKSVRTLPQKRCRVCLQKFTPVHSKQIYCDNICQSNMGKGHDRLESRLRELMILEYQRMRQDIKQEVERQAGLIGSNMMIQFEKRLRKIVREELP